jgi:hypothetical protein
VPPLPAGQEPGFAAPTLTEAKRVKNTDKQSPSTGNFRRRTIAADGGQGLGRTGKKARVGSGRGEWAGVAGR